MQRALEDAAVGRRGARCHRRQRGVQCGRIAADQRRQRRLVVAALEGTGGFGLAEIGKAACEGEQGLVEYIPRHAARLRQHLHRGFRITAGFVVKTPAQRIDLHRAFHHQRPRHQRALRHGPGAVTLVTAEVGQACAQRAAPGDRAAVVAGVAGKGGVFHLGQQLLHHRRIAAKTVAGEDQRVAGQLLQRAVGPLVGDAQNFIAVIEPELAHQRARDDGNVGGFGSLLQTRHQAGAGFFGHGVHAVPAVAGVEEIVQQHKVQPVAGLQGVDRRAYRLGIRRGQVRGRRAMSLGLDVCRKTLRAVFNVFRLLHARVGCGHKARGQRGRAAGHGVALEHHAIDAGVAQHQRRGQAAGAGAHNRNRHMDRCVHAFSAANHGQCHDKD